MLVLGGPSSLSGETSGLPVSSSVRATIGLQRVVEPFGRILVARGGPLVGPVFHREHEAQRPHLREGGQVFLVLKAGALFGRHVGHGAAHVHHFGVVAGARLRASPLRASSAVSTSPQRRAPQCQEALALRVAGKRAAFVVWLLALGGRAQQHGQVFVGGNGAARADHARP